MTESETVATHWVSRPRSGPVAPCLPRSRRTCSPTRSHAPSRSLLPSSSAPASSSCPRVSASLGAESSFSSCSPCLRSCGSRWMRCVELPASTGWFVPNLSRAASSLFVVVCCASWTRQKQDSWCVTCCVDFSALCALRFLDVVTLCWDANYACVPLSPRVVAFRLTVCSSDVLAIYLCFRKYFANLCI